jgi:hypothetical protein
MATPKRQNRKKETNRIPVYFLSLTVENVRCFGESKHLIYLMVMAAPLNGRLF